MTSRTGPIKVAEQDDPAPGTGGAIFSSFGPPVVSGMRILFAAQVSGGTTSSGLFLWNRGAVTKVMADGDTAPGADTFCCGGVFGTTDGVPRIGLSGGNVAFFSPRATTPSGFFLSARSTVKPLVLDGDPTPLGGLFGAVEVQQPISLVGRTMVFEGDVTAGAGVAFGLFNVRP